MPLNPVLVLLEEGRGKCKVNNSAAKPNLETMFHWLSISSIKPPKSVSLVALPKGSLGEYSPSSVNTETPCLGGLSPAWSALEGQKNMLTVRPPCFRMSLPLRQSHRWASSVCDRVKYWDTSSGKGHLLGRGVQSQPVWQEEQRLDSQIILWWDYELILHASEEPWAADYSAVPDLPRDLQRLLPLQSFRPHYLLS